MAAKFSSKRIHNGMLEGAATRSKELERVGGIKVSEILFAVSIAFFLIPRCGLSGIVPIGTMTMAAVALLVFKLAVFSEFKAHDALLFSLCIGIALLSYLNSDGKYLIYLTLFVFAAKDVNFKRICLIVVVVGGSSLVLSVLLSVVGVLPNNLDLSRTVFLGSASERHYFAFSHPNALGRCVLMLLIAWMCYKKETAKALDTVVGLTVFVILFFYVGSKTSALVALFVCCECIVLRRSSGRVAAKSAFAVVFVVTVFMAFMALFYSPSSLLCRAVNEFTTHRLSLAHTCIEQYDVTLFGQWMPLDEAKGVYSASHLVLDNSYLYLLYRFGFVSFAIVIAAYILMATRAYRKGDFLLAVLLAALLIESNFETSLFNVENCILLLGLYGFLFSGSRLYSIRQQ